MRLRYTKQVHRDLPQTEIECVEEQHWWSGISSVWEALALVLLFAGLGYGCQMANNLATQDAVLKRCLGKEPPAYCAEAMKR